MNIITPSFIAVIFGGVFLMLGVLFLLAGSESVLKGMKVFNRNRIIGILFCLMAYGMAAYLLYKMPFGQYDAFKKPVLKFVMPVITVLTMIFMNDLLAPRALGGIFAMLPSPILDIVVWHDSPWRLVIVTSAYVMIICGSILIMWPYYFRLFFEFIAKNSRVRITGIAGILLAFLYFLTAFQLR